MTQGLDYFYGMMCFLIISSRPVFLRPGFRHFRPCFHAFRSFTCCCVIFPSRFLLIYTAVHIHRYLNSFEREFLYHFYSAIPIPPYFIYEHYIATIRIVVRNMQLTLNAISTLINCIKVKITTKHRWLLFHRNTKGRI